jgi:hypothetical protein
MTQWHVNHVLHFSTHEIQKESVPLVKSEEAQEELFRLTELENVTNDRVLLAWDLLDRLENKLTAEMVNQIVDAWRW